MISSRVARSINSVQDQNLCPRGMIAQTGENRILYPIHRI